MPAPGGKGTSGMHWAVSDKYTLLTSQRKNGTDTRVTRVRLKAVISGLAGGRSCPPNSATHDTTLSSSNCPVNITLINGVEARADIYSVLGVGAAVAPDIKLMKITRRWSVLGAETIV